MVFFHSGGPTNHHRAVIAKNTELPQLSASARILPHSFGVQLPIHGMMTKRVWCSFTLAVLLGVARFCVAENTGNTLHGIDARRLLDPCVGVDPRGGWCAVCTRAMVTCRCYDCSGSCLAKQQAHPIPVVVTGARSLRHTPARLQHTQSMDCILAAPPRRMWGNLSNH